MAVAEQLAYETRVRPRLAVLAGAGGVMLAIAAGLQAAGPQPKFSELTIELLTYSRRAGLVVAGAVFNGLGLIVLAATIAFLLLLTRARRPATSQGTMISAGLGGLLAAVGSIAYGIEISSKARAFVDTGAQTYVQANHLVGGTALAALQYVGLLGSLLLAIAFALVSLNAMRVGLLPKFLGYLGIVAAAASILLIESLPAQVIQIAWLLAVGYLVAGRWPGGDPPAWRTGEAVPWPSAAQLREQRESGRGSAGGRGRQAGKPAGQQRAVKPSAPQPVAAAPGSTRATTPKRKRKRRK